MCLRKMENDHFFHIEKVVYSFPFTHAHELKT